MAAINVPEYGDIVPLSEGAEVLVRSDDPEHVSFGSVCSWFCYMSSSTLQRRV